MTEGVSYAKIKEGNMTRVKEQLESVSWMLTSPVLEEQHGKRVCPAERKMRFQNLAALVNGWKNKDYAPGSQ